MRAQPLVPSDVTAAPSQGNIRVAPSGVAAADVRLPLELKMEQVRQLLLAVTEREDDCSTQPDGARAARDRARVHGPRRVASRRVAASLRCAATR